MVPPWSTVLEPVFSISTSVYSLEQSTVVETVWLWLLAGFGSAAEVETDASFSMTPPQVKLLGTSNVTVKFWLCPFVSVKLLHSTLLPLSTHPALEAPGLKVRSEERRVGK